MQNFKTWLCFCVLLFSAYLVDTAKVGTVMKKPLCADGSVSNGSCINRMCSNGMVCNITLNICCNKKKSVAVQPARANGVIGMCLDRNEPTAYCDFFGNCPQNSICTTSNLCCPISPPTFSCPNGGTMIGGCINGLCAVGFTCVQGSICCSTPITNVCSNGGTRLGNCIGELCPSGFTCLQGQCCSNTDPNTFVCENTQQPATERCNDNLECPTATNICVDGVNCCPNSNPNIFTCPTGVLSTERCLPTLLCPTFSFICVDGVNCCPRQNRFFGKGR